MKPSFFSFFFICFNQVITALHGLSSQGQKQSTYPVFTDILSTAEKKIQAGSQNAAWVTLNDIN